MVVMMPVELLCQDCMVCGRLDIDTKTIEHFQADGTVEYVNNVRCKYLDECEKIFTIGHKVVKESPEQIINIPEPNEIVIDVDTPPAKTDIQKQTKPKAKTTAKKTSTTPKTTKKTVKAK